MPRNKQGSTRTRNGKMYARVTYQDDSGKIKEVWRKAETLTHAKELRKQMLRTLDDYGEKPLQAERMLFKDLANYYIDNYLQPPEYRGNRKIAGLRSYKTAKYQFQPVIDHFSSKLLRSITYDDIEKYRLLRLKSSTKNGAIRSIATVNRELAYLRRVLEIAKRQNWIIYNPFNQGDPLISIADEQKRERIITLEEEASLLMFCTGSRTHLRAILICALDTGMRRSEIFKLRWCNINFYTRLITVEALNTKTLKQREIAMTTRLASELLKLYQSSASPKEAIALQLV